MAIPLNPDLDAWLIYYGREKALINAKTELERFEGSYPPERSMAIRICIACAEGDHRSIRFYAERTKGRAGVAEPPIEVDELADEIAEALDRGYGNRPDAESE